VWSPVRTSRFGRGRAAISACWRSRLRRQGGAARDGVSSTGSATYYELARSTARAEAARASIGLAGTVVAGDAAVTLGFPTANLRPEPGPCPARIYAGAADGHRAAISIGTNPHYGGDSGGSGPSCSISGVTYGSADARALAAPSQEQAFRSETQPWRTTATSRRLAEPSGPSAAAGRAGGRIWPGMEHRVPTDRHELVRCLDCGTEYRLPRDTAQADPCPVCGSVGWIAVERVGTTNERK
jgi:hypothetical protein